MIAAGYEDANDATGLRFVRCSRSRRSNAFWRRGRLVFAVDILRLGEPAPTQLKTWRLELEAAGSASAIERQQAEAGELARLRQDNKRLKEEVEVLRKASAFFAQWAAKT